MNQDLPFQVQTHEPIEDQISKKANDKFQETKKSFSSSKNQFLSTIFQTKLAQQKKLSIQKNIDQTSIQNDEEASVKFTISNQYSEFYDPLNDKFFHVKGKRPFYKKIRLAQTDTKQSQEKKKSSKRKTLKQFVQIHQPRNQKHEIEFKLYQQELRKKSAIPGPGAYNISKPLAQPVYETIQKNQNIVLVKLHNVEGTSNFKSKNEKLTAIYDKQKLKNPGPGDYATTFEDLNGIKRERNKSKLDQYAKKYESNYKFIFEVFNSQLNTHEPMPNYSQKVPQNEVVYNGKPVKMQQFYLNVKRQNELKQEKSRRFLHQKAKNPSFSKDFEKKRSISQFQLPQNQNTDNKTIFQFKTVDQEKLSFRQEKFKIYSQVEQKVQNGNSISQKMEYQNKNQALIKMKIQKLIGSIPEQRAQSHMQQYKKKQHLYNGFGYFDGSQRQKLNTKYNVKLDKKDQKLKTLLQPLPNTARKFKSLQVPDYAHAMTSRHNPKKPQHRYHMNMLDILVSQQSTKKQSKSFLPNSRISFMNELGLEKLSDLNATIQY